MTTRASRATPGRRVFLRGAGGAAIALPYLHAREGDTRAADDATVPERLITLFFAHGMPPEIAAAGLTGPLAPLAPFSRSLSMVRGLASRTGGPNNGHQRGCAAFACGMDFRTPFSKGGPSLDWLLAQHFKPATAHPVFAAGVFGLEKESEPIFSVHSWRGSNQPNLPLPDTVALLHHLFGGGPPSDASTPEGRAERRAARLKVSLLDAVVSDYRRAMSDAGNHSRPVRALIAEHLETVRDLERRALARTAELEAPPGLLNPACDPSIGEGVDVRAQASLPQWRTAWDIIVGLVVTALRCDLVRFGSLTLLAGGQAFPYSGPEGTVNDVHAEAFHRWPNQNPDVVRAVVRWQMERVATFLAALDAPESRDANGKTMLENATVMVGTELGNPAPHSREDMTFFLTGGRGRLSAGARDFPGRTDVDLYNTLLTVLGTPLRMGDPRYFQGVLALG